MVQTMWEGDVEYVNGAILPIEENFLIIYV
jgi:hypothetical protein